MLIEFYTWNEIKQMLCLYLINKFDHWSNILRYRYEELAFKDENNVSFQNRPDVKYSDFPKK